MIRNTFNLKFPFILLMAFVFLILISGCTQGTLFNPQGSSASTTSVNPLGTYVSSLGGKIPENFYVKYRIRSFDVESIQSIYVSNKNIRMDLLSEGFESRVIFTENSAISCAKEEGLPWDCENVPVSESERAVLYENITLTPEQQQGLFLMKTTDAGTRSVAGVQAKCFTIKLDLSEYTGVPADDRYGEPKSSNLACYHPNALITLYLESTLTGMGEQFTIVQEALEYSLNPVSSAIFQPPVPIRN